MGWAGAVFVVKFQFHCNCVANLGAGCFANAAVQIQIKTAVADRHHIDAPGIIRLAIDADADRERLAPTLSDAGCARRADQHVGIDFVNGND